MTHIALEYVRRGDKRIHTNGIKNFWSLFKRGVIGSYHHVSVKHLSRYLDEFTFRFSNRDNADLFFLTMLNLVIGIGIRYAELTAQVPDAGPEVELDGEPFWVDQRLSNISRYSSSVQPVRRMSCLI